MAIVVPRAAPNFPAKPSPAPSPAPGKILPYQGIPAAPLVPSPMPPAPAPRPPGPPPIQGHFSGSPAAAGAMSPAGSPTVSGAQTGAGPLRPVVLPSAGETITAADAAPRGASDRIALDPPPPRISTQATATPRTSKFTPRRQSSVNPFTVRVASGILLLIAAAAFCATDPGQKLISPLIARIHKWNTERAPKPSARAASGQLPPGTKSPATSGAAHSSPTANAMPGSGANPRANGTQGAAASNPNPAAAATPLPGPGPSLILKTSHQDILRRLLTERTQTLIHADLRQLIPSYNMMASQQGLPSQREMSEAFRKTYGAVIDPFEELSLLQSDARDEFLIILSSKNELALDKVIGQPARPGPAAGGKPASRIYTVKAGNRTLNAALYDPFTLLLGSNRAIARATQPEGGPQLREARCMFPETAARTPGALIIVKRINLPPAPGEGAPATAFETIVTNLFLSNGTPSTLTLTRNPEVHETAFVSAAAPALKEQAAALAPSLGTDAKSMAQIAPGEINLTLNEASVALPGGSALISSALETMARSFVRSAPSMNSILKAQDAVMRFNSARATGAETALRAASPREALELLNEGIRGGGQYGGATFQFASKDDEIDNLSSLLDMDTAVGLVYRPDTQVLSGSSLDLALKARNYRNAELLILLWQQAKLQAAADESPLAAARRVLKWAASAQGKNQRSMMGLPSLTEDELNGALSHLAINDFQLGWKPGEATYRSWVRLVHPDPRRDASRLAATFNAATAAGAIPASATRDLKAAVNLILRGVTGRGAHADTTFKLDTFTPAEITAATALLTLEDGTMKVTATANPDLQR